MMKKVLMMMGVVLGLIQGSAWAKLEDVTNENLDNKCTSCAIHVNSNPGAPKRDETPTVVNNEGTVGNTANADSTPVPPSK